jgi:hypothetical protein
MLTHAIERDGAHERTGEIYRRLRTAPFAALCESAASVAAAVNRTHRGVLAGTTGVETGSDGGTAAAVNARDAIRCLADIE